MNRDPRNARLSRPDGLTDMLLYRLNRIRAVGGGVVLRLCEGRFGVTRREWVVLALLHDGGPVHSSGLAARADLDKAAMSKAVVSLVTKDLVRRSPRAGDHRYVEIELTDRGQVLIERMLPVMVDINSRILGALEPQEVLLLDELLDRLQGSVNEIANGLVPWPSADRRRGLAARRARSGLGHEDAIPSGPDGLVAKS